MKIDINKEDYEKYDKLELFIKQSKNPVVINGKMQELISSENEFFVKTDTEQFKTNADNIEAIHFKSKLSEESSKVVKEVTEYLDL